jgi:hypothetical protein
MNWTELLNRFACQLNPTHERIWEHYPLDYYMVHQLEWATDIVFREAGFLKRLMPLLVRHGLLSFSSPDVLRYFGAEDQPVGRDSRLLQWNAVNRSQAPEGERVKYRMNGNSAKFSVLRGAETTINTTRDFRRILAQARRS